MKITANDYLKRIEDVSLSNLAFRNIKGILLDVDNTIVKDGETEMTLPVSEWIKRAGMPICLLTNGKEKRAKILADNYGLCYIHRAKKPYKEGYVKAARLLGISNLSQIAVIGDQLFSDILGGNIAGCYTIKIEPIDKSTDPMVVKIKRWFERFIV